MAHRRNSRGQPQYLQFRPYRAIVASGEDRLHRRSFIRAFTGGMISWTVLTSITMALIVTGLVGLSHGTSHVPADLLAKASWIVGIAVVVGFFGGIASAARR